MEQVAWAHCGVEAVAGEVDDADEERVALAEELTDVLRISLSTPLPTRLGAVDSVEVSEGLVVAVGLPVREVDGSLVDDREADGESLLAVALLALLLGGHVVVLLAVPDGLVVAPFGEEEATRGATVYDVVGMRGGEP